MDFDFFALSTAIGKKIEEATSELLVMEDWSLNLEITDEVNASTDGPRDAVRALKKRLGHKNPKVVSLALTVLETCVMNCGLRFAQAMAAKDFMDRLAAVAVLKTAEGERARGLISSWVAGFCGQMPQVQGLYDTYARLRAEGIEFPAVDPTKAAPITMPEQQRASAAAPMPSSATPANPMAPTRPATGMGPVVPSAEEVARLKDNLQVTLGNVGIMNEMLQALGPNEEPGELLQEINATTREMHRRIMVLISQVDHAELMAELLRVNEKLIACLQAYDALVPAPKPAAAPVSTPAPVAVPGLDHAEDDDDDLLLESSPRPLSPQHVEKQMAALDLKERSKDTSAAIRRSSSEDDWLGAAMLPATNGSDAPAPKPSTLDTADELTEEDFDAFLNQATTTHSTAATASAAHTTLADEDLEELLK